MVSIVNGGRKSTHTHNTQVRTKFGREGIVSASGTFKFGVKVVNMLAISFFLHVLQLSRLIE